MSLLDCRMAATALENNRTLATRNVQDVARSRPCAKPNAMKIFCPGNLVEGDPKGALERLDQGGDSL